MLIYEFISDGEQSLFNHVTLQVGKKNAKFNFIENYINIGKDSEPFNIVTEMIIMMGKDKYSSITNQPGAKENYFRCGLTYRDALINWNVAAMDEA